MYPLNFDTCTLRDVIARSVTCHPSMLSDALLDQAETHARAAGVMHDREACRISAGLARAAVVASADAEQGNVDAIVEGFAIGAFIAASRLQCIPNHVRMEIVNRFEAVAVA